MKKTSSKKPLSRSVLRGYCTSYLFILPAMIYFAIENGVVYATGGADIFLDYFMLIIQDYVCTLPGSYSREIFLFVLCYTN